MISTNTIFIPSPVIRVRIAGTMSRHVLYSHGRNNHQLSHVDMNGIWDDQWFNIIPGTDANASLYRIRSEYTNEAVFLNRGQVGTWDFNNTAYADQWFRLEAGTGKNAGTFRLVCPETNAALYSRLAEPQLGYINANDKFDDQYFSFLPEDMEVQQIDYQIDNGKIINTVPKAIASQKATNETSEPQTRSVTLNETIEEEQSFEHEHGVTFGASSTASVGIPLIGEAEITLSAEVSTTLKWGETKKVSKSWSDTVSLTCGPGKTYKVYASARQSTFDVPFIVTWKSKKTGQKMTSKGVYKGVSVYDFDTKWQQI